MNKLYWNHMGKCVFLVVTTENFTMWVEKQPHYHDHFFWVNNWADWSSLLFAMVFYMVFTFWKDKYDPFE